MHQHHSSVDRHTVHRLATSILHDSLAWTDYGRSVSGYTLLTIVVLACVLKTSFSAVVKCFRFGFSHETARKAIHARLDATDKLQSQLLQSLHFMTRCRKWRRRKHRIAIDCHHAPFYGDRATPGVIGGPKKAGTHYAYGYATAVIIHKRYRYTVGLMTLTKADKPHDIVRTLLDQVRDHGIQVASVVLDAGFDSGEVLSLLQSRKLAYAVPLQRKGSKTSKRNQLFGKPVGTLATIEWQVEKTREIVKTKTVVIEREDKVMVIAYGGWTHGEAKRQGAYAKEVYRKRFGIESSYRQMNQAKALTTGKDVAYRLLIVGIALILRQVWVWLTAQIAADRNWEADKWVGELSLLVMLRWLAEVLIELHPERGAIQMHQPLVLPTQPLTT